MKISGFQSFTLSDFPGMTAAIVFTQGCNFRCPFCHNGTLLNIDVECNQLQDQEKIFDSLKRRKNILDGLVITGGEPTIQPDLQDFIQTVRAMGYKIKLDTNGSNPNVVQKLISEKVLDYIAMDIKAPLNKYHLLSGLPVKTHDILKSIEIISRCEVTSEFRTTYVPELLTETDIEIIRSLVPAKSKYSVQEFIPEKAWNWPVTNTTEIYY